MKTILATTYAVNPYKGSEDGMGWNFILQIAKEHKVIAITRENNKEAIEKYQRENADCRYQNIQFEYFDLPYWMRFWKRGQRGAMLYFYLWQFFLPIMVIKRKLHFDVAHNVNFHNDWTASFLWLLGKPFVWGPTGHHPKIPKTYLKEATRKERLKEQITWILKKMFWSLDPFLKITKWKAKHIFCMNSEVEQVLGLKENWSILPSVACEQGSVLSSKNKGKFTVLSVGRFVPLKGFDVTIKSFAQLIKDNAIDDAELVLVGKGPMKKRLQAIIDQEGIKDKVRLIDWIERDQLKALYTVSDVFLFPSHEGAGMVVAEAMSYGLPVLCFDNSGPGEFISVQSGIKVPYSNYDESIYKFAAALELLYRDINYRDTLAYNAQREYAERLTWDHKGEILAKVYDRVLQSQKPVTTMSPKLSQSLR
ncbi:MAG: glycosyltransferase family 4 protein [Flavobacteriales bacterium]|nr:glycosyltransferase family 4 protein [Flavobacteriales bacterium]